MNDCSSGRADPIFGGHCASQHPPNGVFSFWSRFPLCATSNYGLQSPASYLNDTFTFAR
jgi:hypothetical protein